MNMPSFLFFSLLLACEITLIADYCLHCEEKKVSIVAAWIFIPFLLLYIWICSKRLFWFLPLMAVILPSCIGAGLGGCFLRTRKSCKQLHYAYNDEGKQDLYANKKVMLIVPHPDDDMNIACGVLEQYVKYGSDITVVFVTNGDYWNIGDRRLSETIYALCAAGIREDHVYFLGYADGWDKDTGHIYNASPGIVCKSRNGITETYGLLLHPAWHEGNCYTSDHFLDDLESVIMAHTPDTIICTDLDPHIDHWAVTFAFEKVMGRILKRENSYHPVVLKAFAYCTAWTAPKDFHRINLLSTKDPGVQLPGIYRWSERIRFPVDGTKLSRSLIESELYRPVSCYASQRAGIAAGAIINGDKVFWQRRTDTLLLRAKICSSSGDPNLLNDFMLLDSLDLSDRSRQPWDSVWMPEPWDSERTIQITLDAPADIDKLVLYDSPSQTDNILNARITFDNGCSFETGPLDPSGAATVFGVHQARIRSFSISLLETVGDCAGLTEIEAFSGTDHKPFDFIKLMDCNGQFAYDYVIEKSGMECFQLYTFGEAPVLSPQDYRIECNHPDCTARIDQQQLIVMCPVGVSCRISITSRADGKLSDSVFVRNPTEAERIRIMRTQRMEEFFHRRAKYIWRQTMVYTTTTVVWNAIYDVLRKCKYRLLAYICKTK